MAKGAKRKTKWVSLPLVSANTTTSVAAGSDSEQTHHQHHQYGGAHRQKTLNGTSTTPKHSDSKASAGGADSAEEHHSNEPLDRSGNRTDTSGSTSDGPNGHSASDRRTGSTYQRRRPPPYHTRSNWNGGGGTAGATNGRAAYNGGGGARPGYYNGGGGYYGAVRRSHYDAHSTRRSATVTGTNTTTSGDGGGEGGTTINDDEYTRITTPRQDVLFKKGYLSRPKPGAAAVATTASTSNENTASSSIAGTVSEGSDGGNGAGSNSISTTESITSEYGGSFAADGSPLFDYPYPLLPCGYFTENGVLVMNGFAVDNNGYSYFNGGQTYIYPPNFNNCQQQQPHPKGLDGVDPTVGPIPCPSNDKMKAENNNECQATELIPSTPDTDSQMPVPIVANGGASSDDCCSVPDGPSSSPPVESYEVVQQTVPPTSEAVDERNGLLLDGVLLDPGAGSEGVGEGQTTLLAPHQVAGFENGYYQLNDTYDLTQFYGSIYYPNWLMEQYRLFDDAAAPLYCGGEYGMPGGDMYTHQTSFKRRKKRNRTFEEIPGENGTSYDLEEMTNSMVHEIYTVGDGAAAVGAVPIDGEAIGHEKFVVQEFQPATLQNGVATAPSDAEVVQLDQSNPPRVTKKPPPAAKHVKILTKSSTVGALVPVACDASTTTTTSLSNGATHPARPPAMSHKIRRKDLIESTRAFAEQNIDLTRPKVLAAAPSSIDSERACWTTVDRNGRKKRLDQPNGRTAASTPITKERKVPAKDREVKDEQPVLIVEKVPSSTTNAVSAAAVSSSTPSTLEAISPDTSNKKDQLNTKSKKKTRNNKRQQHRKPVGGLLKQHKQEGFLLIEPEFPTMVVHHRTRSCDNGNRKDVSDGEEEDSHEEQQFEEPVESGEQQVVDEREKNTQAESVPPLEIIQKQRERCTVVQDAATLELICDKANETVPVGAPPKMEAIGEKVEEVAQDLLLTILPPSSSPTVVVLEEKIVVNETETEQFVERAPESIVAQEVREVAQEQLRSVECTMYNVKQLRSSPASLIEQTDHESAPKAVVELEEKQVREEPVIEPSSAFLSVEDPVPEYEQLIGIQPPATVVEQRSELSVNTNVLTSAAKQLAAGDRPSVQNRMTKAKDNDLEEGDGNAGMGSMGSGLEEDEPRGKRGSVSGVGYTESIDSGLQSPAPCGGVASPEASSMASSIESDEAPLGQPQPEAPLSQIVAKWLLRKLEVHDLEEVFVLPSDPLLIQRLERFQLLQGRGCRLRGASSSNSEEKEEEDDSDGGSQEDTDSDYMSDGQGKLERSAIAGDETSDTNPSSPLNSADGLPILVGRNASLGGPAGPRLPTDNDDAASPMMQLDAKVTHQREQAASPNPYRLNSSDSRSVNSQTSVTSDSRRCVIM